MNDLLKTTIFAGVALVFTGLAFFSTRDRQPANAADFDDQGKPFFADFKDPLACTDLEVVDFDSSTATASRFRVMFKDNKWVIPSHYNYPADARDRLSNTAAAIMDLTKDTIRSNSPDEQEAMGVIDPLDAKVSTLKGRGKRITLRDASEKVLADIIIGNEIKGTERKDGAGPAVRAGARPEANLRREHQGRAVDPVCRLDRDQPAQGRSQQDPPHLLRQLQDSGETPIARARLVLQRGEKLLITRKDGSGPWTMDGLTAAEQLNENNLRTLSDAVADLKIVGIRPRPAGLSDLNKEDLKVSPIVMASLHEQGLLPDPAGALFRPG